MHITLFAVMAVLSLSASFAVMRIPIPEEIERPFWNSTEYPKTDEAVGQFMTEFRAWEQAVQTSQVKRAA